MGIDFAYFSLQYLQQERQSMRQMLLYGLMLLSVVTNAQENYFKLKAVDIDIPAFLPGIMYDSSTAIIDDTLHYKLKGQSFVGAPIYIDSLTLPYPWKMINEMVAAYKQKDKKRIAALYNTTSQQLITDVLNGELSTEMIDYVNAASAANLRILAGISYKNGFMIYTKDDVNGLHENFVVIENGTYKFSALEDSSAIIWNTALYFKFEPDSIRPVDVPFIDSMHINNSKTIDITLPEGTSWLALYEGESGEPINLLVEDNGINDYNPDPGKISFDLGGKVFVNTGHHTFYAAALNYPVQSINRKLLLPKLKKEIIVY